MMQEFRRGIVVFFAPCMEPVRHYASALKKGRREDKRFVALLGTVSYLANSGDAKPPVSIRIGLTPAALSPYPAVRTQIKVNSRGEAP